MAGPARASLILSVAILLVGAGFVVYAWDYWVTAGILGIDYRVMVLWAERFLETGQPYLAYQLTGPYNVGEPPWVGDNSPIMYPPSMLLLMVPFTVLPAVLWWAVPVAVTAWAVRHHRPRPLVWPFLALLAAFPMTLWFVATGNPIMWITAAVAAGTVRGGWAVGVLLKPSPLYLPFALVGIRRRSWWVALAALCGVSLLLLPLWFDYLAVIRNFFGGNGILYGLNNLPMLMIPVIAWLGRTLLRPELPDGARAGVEDRGVASRRREPDLEGV